MLVHIAPGDPVNAIVPADAPQDVVEQIKHEYGLDRPLPVQFGLWLGHVATGDLGRSLATGRSVWSDLSVALVNTLRLAAVASVIGFVAGPAARRLAGAPRGTSVDRAGDRARGGGGVGAALLAGHGDGGDLQRAAGLAAGDGRRARAARPTGSGAGSTCSS